MREPRPAKFWRGWAPPSRREACANPRTCLVLQPGTCHAPLSRIAPERRKKIVRLLLQESRRRLYKPRVSWISLPDLSLKLSPSGKDNMDEPSNVLLGGDRASENPGRGRFSVSCVSVAIVEQDRQAPWTERSRWKIPGCVRMPTWPHRL